LWERGERREGQARRGTVVIRVVSASLSTPQGNPDALVLIGQRGSRNTLRRVSGNGVSEDIVEIVTEHAYLARLTRTFLLPRTLLKRHSEQRT
jgi:hypothetical protein